MLPHLNEQDGGGMKLFATKNRDSFVKNIRKLSGALQRLQDALDALHRDQNLPPASKAEIHQAATSAERICRMIPALLAAHMVTLSEQEYLRFCDLLICGNEMAEYIDAIKNAKTNTRRHVKYWHHVAIEFKPFLEKIADFYAKSK